MQEYTSAQKDKLIEFHRREARAEAILHDKTLKRLHAAEAALRAAQDSLNGAREKAFRDGYVWGYDDASGTPPTAGMTLKAFLQYKQNLKNIA